MRYVAIVSLVVVLCVAGAWAGLNPETGAMDGPWKVQTGPPSPKNVNVPVSIPTISINATRPEALGDVKALHYESLIQQLMGRDGQTPNQPPHILWGTDVLIRSDNLYRISVDCFTNGPYNAYAAVQQTRTTGSDTVFIFRTTNQGYSWESWSQGPYVYTDYGFEKQKVLCMPGDTNWVVNLFLENPAGGRRWMYARFMDPQSGNFRWSIIDNAPADTIYDFDAALQNGVNNPIIYTTYTKRFNSTADSFVIWKVRSTDWGRTWVTGPSSGATPTRSLESRSPGAWGDGSTSPTPIGIPIPTASSATSSGVRTTA